MYIVALVAITYLPLISAMANLNDLDVVFEEIFLNCVKHTSQVRQMNETLYNKAPITGM